MKSIRKTQEPMIPLWAIIIIMIILANILYGCGNQHVYYSQKKNCLMVQQESKTHYHCYNNPAAYAVGENLDLSPAQKSWNAYVAESRKKNQLKDDLPEQVDISYIPNYSLYRNGPR